MVIVGRIRWERVGWLDGRGEGIGRVRVGLRDDGCEYV